MLFRSPLLHAAYLIYTPLLHPRPEVMFVLLALTLPFIVGVAYLLYMAWITVREKGAVKVDSAPAPRSATRVIVSGVLVNLLNPKLTIFFFAFLPQFVSVDEAAAWPRMLELSSVFMLVTLVVFVIYGLLAAGVRNRILSRPRVMAWVRRIFAGSFVALAGRLAFTNR